MSRQKSRRAKVRPSRHRGYPLEAIKDFFDQLLWEVRASHFEVCHPEARSDELVHRIGHYMSKYGVALLPIVNVRFGPNFTEEQIKEALTILRVKIRDRREEELRHFEALRPLIAEALKTAQASAFHSFQEATKSKQQTNRFRLPRDRRRGYPLEAIRDFFEHLFIHVKASHFEQCHSGACDVGLGDRLGQYMKKYGVFLLPIVTYRADPSLSAEAVNTWLSNTRAKIKAEREEQLQHLDALRPLIAKALETAEQRPLK